MRMKWLAALTGLFAGTGVDAKPFSIKAGQVWEYRTRPQDAGSLVKIQKVSRDGVRSDIYHVTIIGMKMRNPRIGGNLTHAPVSRGVLEMSLTKRSRRAPSFPSADEGMAEWKKAGGGVFTIRLNEIAELIDAQTADAPM